MTLTVFTAIIGQSRDVLHAPLAPPDPLGRAVRYVCFSDGLSRSPGGYEMFPPARLYEDPRLTARWHKTHAHELFPGSDYSLWHDGCLQVKVSPWSMVDRHLVAGCDFATFKHPERSCAYHELHACVALRKGDPGRLRAQLGAYEKEGFPRHRGLFETAAVLRRNTADVRAFDEAWWAEIRDRSPRDQLSVNYLVWKRNLSFAHLPGKRDEGPYFVYYPHNK